MESDKNIQEKLAQRTIMPSESAWERLSHKLDAHGRRKRSRMFFYIGVAASVLLLISIFLPASENDGLENKSIPEQKIVEQPADAEKFNDKIKDITKKNEVIIADKQIPVKEIIQKKKITKKKAGIGKEKLPVQKTITPEKEVVAKNDPPEVKDIKTAVKNSPAKKRSSTGISVDSDALLYSVTHTEEEVIAYYRKYKIDREDVLDAIKKQLKKSNLTIDPKMILADVEQDIDDANFRNNFMSFIKKRVSDLAAAIATRND